MPCSPLDRLSADQYRQIEAFEEQLRRFNQAHNLISRRTERAIRTRHTLHSLALAAKPFRGGVTVVDWGTGGGLPALPLAIAFPEVAFVAIDSVRKKIRSVRAMTRRLGLDNVTAWHGRAGDFVSDDFEGEVRYSVSRAAAPLANLWRWHQRVAAPSSTEPPAARDHAWPFGLLALKGGDLSDEVAALREQHRAVHVEMRPLTDLLGEEHFSQKCILQVARAGRP